MRSAGLWTVIACSAAAFRCGSAATQPDREAVPPPPPPLQEFDSNILKISWLRIVPIMEPEQSPRGTKGRVLRGEAEYTVVFSHGWLRKHGFRVREKHLKGVEAMMMGWSPQGIPDETMRVFVGELLRLGLRRLPSAGAELTPELIRSLRALAANPLRYYEWQWARIIVVESDRGRIVVMPHLFRDRADLIETYKGIDNYVSKIMTPLAPRVGIGIVESEEGDRE